MDTSIATAACYHRSIHLPQILLEALNLHLILCSDIWSCNLFVILIHDDNDDVFYTG